MEREILILAEHASCTEVVLEYRRTEKNPRQSVQSKVEDVPYLKQRREFVEYCDSRGTEG